MIPSLGWYRSLLKKSSKTRWFESLNTDRSVNELREHVCNKVAIFGKFTKVRKAVTHDYCVVPCVLRLNVLSERYYYYFHHRYKRNSPSDSVRSYSIRLNLATLSILSLHDVIF